MSNRIKCSNHPIKHLYSELIDISYPIRCIIICHYIIFLKLFVCWKKNSIGKHKKITSCIKNPSFIGFGVVVRHKKEYHDYKKNMSLKEMYEVGNKHNKIKPEASSSYLTFKVSKLTTISVKVAS